MIPNYAEKRSTTSWIWPAALMISLTGCTTFEMPPTPFARPANSQYLSMSPSLDVNNGVQEQAYYAVRQAKAENSIVLEVVSDSNPARLMPLPVNEKAVYVSDLLTDTGVLKKLKTIEATLYRYSPGTLNGIPMEVRMSNDLTTVRPESDYALQAGDRLRVRQASNPAMQNLYNVFLGR
ncbi:MAG: hypothetical protein OSA98_06125 [Rubripirellula sp.]|jgi:hypothetical protein|nr:hypothetical protein [Rubripirellula sp.]|tara:strand:+ start:385 stop:921 length:537 start_codon:yes stop_codon:yes gene_type:complete